jgi:hypothetical protein
VNKRTFEALIHDTDSVLSGYIANNSAAKNARHLLSFMLKLPDNESILIKK